MKRMLACVLASTLATSAISRDRVTPPLPEPANHPDWAKVRASAEFEKKTSLQNPDTARFSYTSGFQWEYRVSILPGLGGGVVWGWFACGSVRTEQSGSEKAEGDAFVILAKADGTISVTDADPDTGPCHRGKKVALQPELKGVGEELSRAERIEIMGERMKLIKGLKAIGAATEKDLENEKKKAEVLTR